MHVLLGFMIFMCPFINYFNLVLNSFESSTVFSVLVNLTLKIAKGNFLTECIRVGDQYLLRFFHVKMQLKNAIKT